MSTVRRTLLLVVITAAVLVTSAVRTAPAAHAQWADTVSGGMQLATATVAAPGTVTGNLACTRPAVMSATWTASTSARVTGYQVTVYFSDGFVQKVNPLPATATSWSASIEPYYVTAFSVQYSVTTLTDYGWSKESPRTPAFQC
jgi:hypothetical protein